MIKTLFLSSLVFNFGIMLGRLSGFAREAFIASAYGTSTKADIVVLMLTVPDLLVNILMGGALGAVLVPEFSQKTSSQARQLLYQASLLFGFVFVGITVGLYWQVGTLVDMLAPGFIDVQKAQASVALGWVLWLIPLTVLAGVVTAYLHSKNKFMVAALGTLIINSSIIIGLIIANSESSSLFIVAIFVLVGGGLRLLSQLSQVEISWNPLASLRVNQLHRILLIRYGQAMLSGSILLLFPVVARALASNQGGGSIAIFHYATRLVEFPLVIAVTFLATIFFPRLSESFTNNLEQHTQLIKYGVQIAIGLSLVATVTLILSSKAYIQIIYGYGNMNASDLILVENLVKIGLLGLPLQGLSSLLTATFNARKNTRTPLLINGVGLMFFSAINYIDLFGQELDALMWMMVASYGLICSLQLIFLNIQGLNWREVFFEKTFLIGIGCALILLIYVCKFVEEIALSSWLTLILVCITAFISLCIMALFNEDIRSRMKMRLSEK